jgi:hypothetical protein
MIVPTILAKKTRRISSGEELVAPTTVVAMVAAFWANNAQDPRPFRRSGSR